MSAEMPPKKSHELSKLSINICDQLGISGRVFANDKQALAILEGPTVILQRYYQAIQSDKVVSNVLLHVEREVKTREFSDYSIWLNSKESLDYGPQIKRLRPETLSSALPPKPSGKLRIMIEAYLKPDLLVDCA